MFEIWEKKKLFLYKKQWILRNVMWIFHLYKVYNIVLVDDGWQYWFGSGFGSSWKWWSESIVSVLFRWPNGRPIALSVSLVHCVCDCGQVSSQLDSGQFASLALESGRPLAALRGCTWMFQVHQNGSIAHRILLQGTQVSFELCFSVI